MVSKRDNILSDIKAIDTKMAKLQYRKQQLTARLRELDSREPSKGPSFVRRAARMASSMSTGGEGQRGQTDFKTSVTDIFRRVLGIQAVWSVSELPGNLRVDWTEEQLEVARAVAFEHNRSVKLGDELRF